MNRDYDYYELEKKCKNLKSSVALVVILIVVVIILFLIPTFSKTEITIDEFEGNIYIHETTFWGLKGAYKEIRYINDRWEIKENGSWEELFFFDDDGYDDGYYEYLLTNIKSIISKD